MNNDCSCGRVRFLHLLGTSVGLCRAPLSHVVNVVLLPLPLLFGSGANGTFGFPSCFGQTVYTVPEHPFLRNALLTS